MGGSYLRLLASRKKGKSDNINGVNSKPVDSM